MRIWRVVGTLGLAGLCMTCADPAAGPGPGFGNLAIRAVAPPSLAAFASNLVVERVEVSVFRYLPNEDTEVLAERTLPFDDNTNQLTVSFSLPLEREDTLNVSVSYETLDGSQLFFSGSSVVVAPGRISNPPALDPIYVGPGNSIAFMNITPPDSVLSTGDVLVYDVTAFDVTGLPVPNFYLSWSTNDPRVAISPRGQVVAPDLTRQIAITARTPNQVTVTTSLTLLGSETLGIDPDSVEKLPNSTQLFRVAVGPPTAGIIWSVNGVDGGSAEFGSINVDGFYTAPPAVPNPSKFKVCARDAQNTAVTGCATVIIRTVPSVGSDVIVVNDLNLFDSLAMTNAGNVRFVRNLLNFNTAGPRSDGKVVWYDRSRAAPCVPDGFCGDLMHVRLDAVVRGAGYSITKLDFTTPLTNIPLDVKLLVLWVPTTFFGIDEINELKQFAGEGGRILFVGEHSDYYLNGIDVQNAFLSNMGSQMVNLGSLYDCLLAEPESVNDYVFATGARLKNHPLLNGITRLAHACASEVQVGANDFALFSDTTDVHVLAGVAKIDLTPISDLRQPSSLRRPASRTPAVRGNSYGVLRR